MRQAKKHFNLNPAQRIMARAAALREFTDTVMLHNARCIRKTVRTVRKRRSRIIAIPGGYADLFRAAVFNQFDIHFNRIVAFYQGTVEFILRSRVDYF